MNHIDGIKLQKSKRRLYVEFIRSYISNLAFFGKSSLLQARKPLENHVHNNTIEICYLASGEQHFWVGKQNYVMRGGDVFITYPGEEHGSGSKPMEKSLLYWLAIDLYNPPTGFLSLSLEEGEMIRQDLLAMQNRFFKGNDRLKLNMEGIIEVFFGNSKMKRLLMQHYLIHFLLEVIRLSQQNAGSAVSSLMCNAQDYIDHHILESVKIADVASYCRLSVSRFKQRFRIETGIAPNEYILRRKVLKAKKLLQSGFNVTQTALELDFSSSQYFATVFKKYANVAPSQFTSFSKSC